LPPVLARNALIDPARLRELTARSDWRGAVQTGSHFSAVALAGLALHAALGTLWGVPAFLGLGVLINFLYAGQHEFSHATVFRGKALNAAFGRLIGFILITPRDADKVQHFAHHRYTNLWRQDGELYRPPFTLASYLLRLSGVEYWWANVSTLALYAAGVVREPYVDGPSRGTVILEARLHLLGYGAIAAASVWAHSWAAALYWLGPMLLTKPFHQLQNTIEHVGLPHVPDLMRNTRSTRTNAVMRWLAWQMPYHSAHHAFPSVPFFRLKALHQEIFTARGVTPPTMTYFGFQAAAIAALRRKPEADYPDDQVWIGPGALGLDPAEAASAASA